MWYGTGTKYRRNHRFFLEPPHLQAYDQSPVDLWDIRDWRGLSQWGELSLKLRCISGHWIEVEKHLKLEWSIKKNNQKKKKPTRGYAKEPTQMSSYLCQVTGHPVVGKYFRGCHEQWGRRQSPRGFGPSLDLFLNQATLLLFF